MADKHLVVQGAICMCNFGSAPDRLKVLTNQKEYANDSGGCTEIDCKYDGYWFTF